MEELKAETRDQEFMAAILDELKEIRQAIKVLAEKDSYLRTIDGGGLAERIKDGIHVRSDN